MIDVFLSRAESFRIHHYDIDHLVFFIFVYKRLSPYPNTLRFGICSRSYCKPTFLLEHNGIEKVWLSSSIDSCDWYDGYFSFNWFKKIECLGVYLILSSAVFPFILLPEYKWNCLFLIFFHLNFIFRMFKYFHLSSSQTISKNK
jgi:hypothetical protein